MKRIDPVPQSEMLWEEFLKPRVITTYWLANEEVCAASQILSHPDSLNPYRRLSAVHACPCAKRRV